MSSSFQVFWLSTAWAWVTPASTAAAIATATCVLLIRNLLRGSPAGPILGRTAALSHPGFLFLLQAQDAALHLACRGHRQGVDELDLLRVFVGRELALDVHLQLRDELVVALRTGCEHDESFHQ